MIDWFAVLRWGWTIAAAVAIVRSVLNWLLVRRADEEREKANLNGILKVRSKYTKGDVRILGWAMAMAFVAGGSAILAFPVLALPALVLEHVLLVWLTFNFTNGWRAVNRTILEMHLRLKVRRDDSPLDPHGPERLKPLGEDA